MAPGSFRTARYARAWLSGHDPCVEEIVQLDRDGVRIPARIVRPARAREPLPAWVVLHGITRRGSEHAQLHRFTRSVVSTGAVAIVPEVPEWMDLSLAPGLAVPTVKAGVAGLKDSGWALDAPVGVIGFSFGGPHAVAATAHPDIGEDVAGSVAFGGYCDLRRTVRFLLTGAHEWEGRSYRLTPDAYGRWIIGANYLTAVEANTHATEAARALRALAQHAGDTGISSLDSRMDVKKAGLRASIPVEQAELFDLFAPAGRALPDPARAYDMAEALVEAAVRNDPEIEPAPRLAAVSKPVHLLHGRRDHLIPFSESLRLRASLPESTGTHLTVTRLFGHSAQDSFPSFLKAAREVPVFVAALRRVLRLV